MQPTRAVQQSAKRVPLIKFLGKRSTPQSVDHTPAPHPASPDQSLPQSFAQYRAKAQQHGPLSGNKPTLRVDSNAYGGIGGATGQSLGAVAPPKGMFFDRSELPERFRRLAFTESEMEAISSGGASQYN